MTKKHVILWQKSCWWHPPQLDYTTNWIVGIPRAFNRLNSRKLLFFRNHQWKRYVVQNNHMVNIACFLPIWVRLHPFGPFRTKTISWCFLGHSTLEQKLELCLNWSKTVKRCRGCFFYWSALEMTKCQTLRKFWHLELCWRDLHAIWHWGIF